MNYKGAVFDYLGFKFELNSAEVNVQNIQEAISLGPRFNAFCRHFNLDCYRATQYVKNYIIHRLCDRIIMSLTEDEISLIELSFEESVGKHELGDVLNDAFYSGVESYLEVLEPIIADNFSNRKGDKFGRNNNKILSAMLKTYEDDKIKNNYVDIVKTSGKLASIYFTLARQFRKPLVTRADKIRSNTEITKSYFENSKEFLNILIAGSKDFDVSEDLLQFERHTKLLFLMKVFSNIKYLEATDSQQLKLISTVSLIDDISLKLYIVDQLFKDSCILLSPKSVEWIINLCYLYIPFLSEYIFDQVIASVPSDTFQCQQESNDNKKMIHLKKKLFVYYNLTQIRCYDPEYISKEVGVTEMNNVLINGGYSKEDFDFFYRLYTISEKITYDVHMENYDRISKYLRCSMLKEGEKELCPNYNFAIGAAIALVAKEFLDVDMKLQSETMMETLDFDNFFNKNYDSFFDAIKRNLE